MENKYYTPSIEDIRVGYELEYHNWSRDERGEPKLNFDRWESTILKEGNVSTFMKYGITKGVRVPYLTKEQIEKEEWKQVNNLRGNIESYLTDKKDYDCYFKKGWCLLHYNKLNTIEVSYTAGIYPIQILYVGKCPSINEFRTITKLLGL